MSALSSFRAKLPFAAALLIATLATGADNPLLKPEEYDVSGQETRVAEGERKVNELSAVQNPTDAQRKQLEAAKTELQNRKARLETLRGNLQAAKDWAVIRATYVGKVHGNSAGVTRGTDDASKAAEEAGKKEALDEFNAQVATRMTDLGTRRALEDAVSQSARALSKDQAVTLAVSASPLDGVPEGTAFDAEAKAKAAGVAFGESAAGQKKGAAVAKAQADAKVAGEKRAIDTAASDAVQPAKAQIQKDFYEAAALPVRTLENRATIPSRSFESAAAYDYSKSPHYKGDMTFPHPEIAFAWKEAYDKVFLPAAAEAYEPTYTLAFERLKRSQKHWEGVRLLAQPLSKEAKDFQDKVYGERLTALKTALGGAFDARMGEILKAVMSAAYGPAELAAYTALYPKTFQQNVDSALAAEKDRLGKEFVAELAGAVAVDFNEDSIFAQGEGSSLVINLRAFSRIPQTGTLKLRVRGLTRGLSGITDEDTIIPVKGPVMASVTRVAPFFVSQEAPVGSVQKLEVELLHDGNSLGKLPVTFTVGQPYQILGVSGFELPRAGAVTRLRVTVKNVSTKPTAAPGELKIFADAGSRYEVAPAAEGREVAAGLAPGRTQDVYAELTVADAHAFESLPVSFGIWQQDWLLGQRDFTTNSTLEHTAGDQARGLLVVDSNEGGQLARALTKAAGGLYDIYDRRQRNVNENVMMGQYAGRDRVVVLVGVEKPSEAVGYSIDLGGQALWLANGPADTERLVDRWQPFLLFSTSFGLDLASVRQASFFKGDPKNDIDRWTAISPEKRPGAAAVWIVSGRKNAQILKVMDDFEAYTVPFTQKVERFKKAIAARSNAVKRSARAALLYDLRKELSEASMLPGATGRRGEKVARLRHFVNAALAAKGAERKALASLYPEIEQINEEYLSGGMFSALKRYVNMLLSPLERVYEETRK